jgi:L-lysine exporter family protein LysE/ArgO
VPIWLSGFILGLTMIVPIGPQNLFVLQQGLMGGWQRGILAAGIAGICDTILIIVGALGASALITTQPWLQICLFIAGSLMLVYLGITNLIRPASDLIIQSSPSTPVMRQIAAVISVSWGNPHAIIDTLVVLGAAIASQPADGKAWFAIGTISASWCFFGVLALGGVWIRRYLSPTGALWIQRVTGVLMLIIAVALIISLIQSIKQ